MKKTHSVYKYELHAGQNNMQLPYGSEILFLDMQADTICMWVLVHLKNVEEEIMENRLFHVFSTGDKIPDMNYSHIGSVQQVPLFVWHVFEVAKG